MSFSVRGLEVVRNTILTSPGAAMATPLGVAETHDGPRPERVALLSGDYRLKTHKTLVILSPPPRRGQSDHLPRDPVSSKFSSSHHTRRLTTEQSSSGIPRACQKKTNQGRIKSKRPKPISRLSRATTLRRSTRNSGCARQRTSTAPL
jgi:hypothetical protein